MIKTSNEYGLLIPWTKGDIIAFKAYTKTKMFGILISLLGCFFLSCMILSTLLLDKNFSDFPVITWMMILFLTAFPLIDCFFYKRLVNKIIHRHTSFVLKQDGLYVDGSLITNIRLGIISNQFMFMKTSRRQLYILKIDYHQTADIIQFIQAHALFPIKEVPYSFSIQLFAYTSKIRKRGK